MLEHIDLAFCLFLDKRYCPENDSKIFADFYKGADCVIDRFLAGEGKLFPPEYYQHIDVVPPHRTGYPAWVNRPNSYNAFLCFRKMIEQAKKERAENLLIVEDDAVVLPDFKEVYDLARVDLSCDPMWEMLYLGANHTFSRTEEVTENLLRLNGSGCWHAVVLNHRVYDKILALPMDGPIDGQCGKIIHPDRHCYAVWPNIVVTKPGFSYCEGRDVDYSDLFKNKGC